MVAVWIGRGGEKQTIHLMEDVRVWGIGGVVAGRGFTGPGAGRLQRGSTAGDLYCFGRTGKVLVAVADVLALVAVLLLVVALVLLVAADGLGALAKGLARCGNVLSGLRKGWPILGKVKETMAELRGAEKKVLAAAEFALAVAAFGRRMTQKVIR